MQLHRAILPVKLILVAVLIWAIFDLLSGDYNEQETPVVSRAKVEVPKTEISSLERQPLSTDYEVILERNLFHLSQHAESDTNDASVLSSERQGNTELQLRLLGTVAGNEKFARAVIEDLETSSQGLYATGDSIQGARIERIERNRIVLLHEDIEQILDLHVASRDAALPDSNVKSTVAKDPSVSDVVRVVSDTEREIDTRAFTAKVGRMDTVLKSVKFTPHVVDEKEEGLRITDLEGLNVASYIGLRKGDIVQGLNGQTITNRRKAFQVLRRAQSLPSSHVEFMRGTEKKTLSLKMQ